PALLGFLNSSILKIAESPMALNYAIFLDKGFNVVRLPSGSAFPGTFVSARQCTRPSGPKCRYLKDLSKFGLQFCSPGLMAECDPPPRFRHPQHYYMYRCGSTCPFFTSTLNPL